MSTVRAFAAARALLEAEEAFFTAIAVSEDTIAAAYAMAHAFAAGIRLRLEPGGQVEMHAPRRPSDDVVEELRRCRVAVRRLLAGATLVQSPETPRSALQRFRVCGGGI